MSRLQATHPTACKICGGASPLFALVDSGKSCSQEEPYPFGLLGHPVYYARCGECAFVFTTEFDDWTVQRWSDEIYNSDYERVDPDFVYLRPQSNAEWLARIVRPELRGVDVLDFGSGNGKTEEFLRNHGFEHVASFDPVFHPDAPDGRFDLVTAFEVVEHSPDPVVSFQRMVGLLKLSGLLVFQTCLTPQDLAVQRSGWWYMSPRNGHVSLYSAQALRVLAGSHGLESFTDGVANYMYDAGNVPTAPLGALRLIESFVGWPEPRSDYAVLARGAWHYREETHVGGPSFRWTSAAHGASLLIVRPAGMVGTITIAVTIVMVADDVDDVRVAPIEEDVDLVGSETDGPTHRFVLRTAGTRHVEFSISTSRATVPTNGDLRTLGVAILRPVLTLQTPDRMMAERSG